MIESRYSIEYVEPGSGSSKSSLGKFFAYSLLVLGILLLISAFVFKNLSKEASNLVIEKVQQFTNIEFIKPSDDTHKALEVDATSSTNLLEVTPTQQKNTETISNNQEQNELKQQLLLSVQQDKENKLEIKRLSQENSKQHEETGKQLQENKELIKRISEISQQLKEKNQQNDKIVSEMKLLKSTNSELTSSLEESKKIKLQNNTAKTTIESPQTSRNVVTREETTAIETKEPEKSKPIKKEQVISKVESTPEKEKKVETTKSTSGVDAIVAAMEAANRSQKTVTNTEANSQ